MIGQLREHDREDREVKGKLKYRKKKAHRISLLFLSLHWGNLGNKDPTGLFSHISTKILLPSYLRKQSIFDTSQARGLIFILTAAV